MDAPRRSRRKRAAAEENDDDYEAAQLALTAVKTRGPKRKKNDGSDDRRGNNDDHVDPIEDPPLISIESSNNALDSPSEDVGSDVEESAFFPDVELEEFEDRISEVFQRGDFVDLPLKPDHSLRPLWVCEDGRVMLEAFSPIAEHAQDFLTAISEPLTRPTHVHEYRLTEYSLYAAVSVGLETEGIIDVLNRLSKCPIPKSVENFIRTHTTSYAKAKLVLKQNRYWVESADEGVLRTLLSDGGIRAARVSLDSEDDSDGLVTERAPDGTGFSFAGFGRIRHEDGAITAVADEVPNPTSFPKDNIESARSGFFVDPNLPSAVPNHSDLLEGIDLFELFAYDPDEQDMLDDIEGNNQKEGPVGGITNQPEQPDGITEEAVSTAVETTVGSEPYLAAAITVDNGDDEVDADAEKLVRSFEVEKSSVEVVKKRCSELSFPLLEEYDFRQDQSNPDLEIDLKSTTVLRQYQEKSLSKLFGNGRARSGIIVLPCGAGKTLVGVTAACTIRKSCLVLCTSSVSVEQWRREFRTWSTVKDGQIARFTSQDKEKFAGDAGILISTYTMVTFSGKRAYDAQQLMDFIASREWGFLLLDEVHVVPADMFRKVLTIVAAHAKLGLTATLVREDDKIGNLNYLIGPKLYEANWMDLARKGHIANVQCAEVWCPMTTEFYREYLREKSRKRQLLYAMNPRKLQSCQYLINYHEARGDKTIVFSDNVFALKHYATMLNKPYIYGGTSPVERLRILQQFQYNPTINTIFLSKVGDTSIDIPEATCLIQVSSHYGSRRQEAQRLGRILRAKRRTDDGINAYFYSLVSRDTEEVYYSSKRQQFLIDQGYQFKVITQLEGIESIPDLVYPTRAAQLELLSTVLVSTDTDDEDILPADDVSRFADERSNLEAQVVRRSGTMQSLSGGDSMAYYEYAKTSSNWLFGKGRRKWRTS
ncbi:hypothetical protein HDU85_007723 [Gaertneriomyces sp. JEL0708]|nr:hypothetical protein HDU85_007723 [Gaertneriomyces sp. JEL0708]